MIDLLTRLLHWILTDRGLTITSTILSTIAILLGLFGIWRAEWLFRKLDHTLAELIGSARRHSLQEASNVASSYAAFIRAMQFIEPDPMELPKDAGFALMTAFRFLQLLNPNLTVEQFAALRKQTRDNVEKTAHQYAHTLIESGLGTLRPGIKLRDPSN